jgi:signal transduction histidine kinase
MTAVLIGTFAADEPNGTSGTGIALEISAAFAAVLLLCLLAYERYWQTMISRELAERRRLAAGLHDGLVQELALISRSVRRLDGSDDRVRRIASAADRALYESQEAVRALNSEREETLAAALQRLAVDIGEREGVRVEARVAPGVQAGPAQRDAVVRAAREGIVNSARHGHAGHVDIDLTRRPIAGNETRLALRVSDDGDGFDPALLPLGLGLTMVGERAQRLGGELKIESAPRRGAVLELVV